tara:strand:+ start:138871 stop:139872 length:1002 start_codon:yes stop_codon:yes gene_type:complete
MSIKNIFIYLFILIVSVSKTRAQDPQFSQYYANPLYLNPAFAGNVYLGRISLNYRKQWPSIPGAFTSYNFGIDHHFRNAKSGVGLLVLSDKAGSGGLSYTKVSGLYSYYLNVGRKKVLRFGLSAALAQRAIDFSKLTFGDQIITGNSTSISASNIQSLTYIDFNTGVLYYTPMFWFGASFNHLNKPNDSFYGRLIQIPIKVDIHTGLKIPLNKNIKGKYNTSMFVTTRYRFQQEWDQLDLGFYLQYKTILAGIWYRGLPIKQYAPGRPNNDALIFMLGWEWEYIHFGYSYDLTISALAANTGGSHEISIITEYPFKKNKKKRKRDFYMPCPKF